MSKRREGETPAEHAKRNRAELRAAMATVADPTIAAPTNFDPKPRPRARVIPDPPPAPEPWAPTHILDARFHDGTRVRIRVRLVQDGVKIAAYTQAEWEEMRPPGRVDWQIVALGGEWLCGGATLAACKVRPVDASPARPAAVYTTTILVRCTPEQKDRWQRAADADTGGNVQEFIRRSNDEAAAFALREKP